MLFDHSYTKCARVPAIDTKRMPLMILDFNGFMQIVYANRGRKYHMLRYQRNDMKLKTGESCLLQVLPYFNAKVKMAELGIRQGTGQ